MYDNFDKSIYLIYKSEFITKLHKYILPSVESKFASTAFDILWQTVFIYAEDYALFNTYLKQYGYNTNSVDTVSIGMKCIQNFVSFWDYLAYMLYEIFMLDIDEREVIFSVTKKELSKKYPCLKKEINKINLLYESEATVRKYYRNPFTHRYHDFFFQNDNEETTENKVSSLENILSKSFEKIFKTLELLHKIIVFAPEQSYGRIVNK